MEEKFGYVIKVDVTVVAIAWRRKENILVC